MVKAFKEEYYYVLLLKNLCSPIGERTSFDEEHSKVLVEKA